MAPSSQMAVASSTSGMALASSVLRTASALDFWTYAAWTPTSSPLPLLQLWSTCPSVARGTRTDSELGSRASTSTSPNSGSGLTCVPSLLRSPSLRIQAMLENLRLRTSTSVEAPSSLLGSSSPLPTVLPSSSRNQPSRRSDVENGTPRTRQSPGPTRTDTSRTWTSTQSSTRGTSPMTGLSSTPPRTLTFKPTLTLSAFPSQRNSLISRHALPQGGERTSLELLEITRLCSRRSTCQLSAMTSARPPSEPPGLAKDSSLTTLSSALVELTARTLARETEAVPLSARASLT